jgi:hypothetical protein
MVGFIGGNIAAAHKQKGHPMGAPFSDCEWCRGYAAVGAATMMLPSIGSRST